MHLINYYVRSLLINLTILHILRSYNNYGISSHLCPHIIILMLHTPLMLNCGYNNHAIFWSVLVVICPSVFAGSDTKFPHAMNNYYASCIYAHVYLPCMYILPALALCLVNLNGLEFPSLAYVYQLAACVNELPPSLYARRDSQYQRCLQTPKVLQGH